MSSPAAGAARISRPTRQSRTRRVIAAGRSSGAGGSPALALGRRLHDRRLDVQAAALEVFARGFLDRAHLVLGSESRVVYRTQLRFHALRCVVVAGMDCRAEVAQLAVAARVELEQLVPQPRQPPPRLGANGRRADDIGGAVAG